MQRLWTIYIHKYPKANGIEDPGTGMLQLGTDLDFVLQSFFELDICCIWCVYQDLEEAKTTPKSRVAHWWSVTKGFTPNISHCIKIYCLKNVHLHIRGMQTIDTSSLGRKKDLGAAMCCLLCLLPPTFPYLSGTSLSDIGFFQWKSVCLFDSEELSSALIQRLDHVSQGASTWAQGFNRFAGGRSTFLTYAYIVVVLCNTIH